MAKEPCIRCGEETGVGSAWFSELCDPRIRSSRPGQRLTADGVHNLTRHGSAAGLTWGGGTGGIGSGG